MSGMNKVNADRSQRQLMELVSKPGNDICADCKARMPRWSSWNLGIFVCVQCASVHRKMGTHISKVKSLTLDTWTKEQVDSVKNMGNVKSNQYFNPDERRHPPPTNLEGSERDSELEKYIRSKYEAKRFVVKEMLLVVDKEGSLPPIPHPDRSKSKSTPLPAIIASKPSPPPPPMEEQRNPVFGSTLQYRPSISSPRRSPSSSRPLSSLSGAASPPPMTQQPSYGMTLSTPAPPGQRVMAPQFAAPTPPQSALPASSPVYNDMMALQSGGPLSQSSQPTLSVQMPSNPFHAMQQRSTLSPNGSMPAYPSSFAPHSPARSFSMPVNSPSQNTLSPSIISPPLSVQSTGINPFFSVHQQQAYLQPSPTGYQMAAHTMTPTSAMPINIPMNSPFQSHMQQSATPSFQPSPSSYLQPAPSPSASAYSQSSPSPFYPGPGTSPYQSAFQPSAAYPQSQSAFSPANPFPSQSPYSQAATPVAPQNQDQGALNSFASSMLPQQGRTGTNPFGNAWQGQGQGGQGQPYGGWAGS